MRGDVPNASKECKRIKAEFSSFVRQDRHQRNALAYCPATAIHSHDTAYRPPCGFRGSKAAFPRTLHYAHSPCMCPACAFPTPSPVLRAATERAVVLQFVRPMRRRICCQVFGRRFPLSSRVHTSDHGWPQNPPECSAPKRRTRNQTPRRAHNTGRAALLARVHQWRERV